MNLIDALDDPELFQPHYQGNTWGGWRSFAKAIFALPPTDADLAWFRAHCGRQEWPGVPFKEAALCVGRRGGKSRFLALLGVFLATCREYAPYLAPGEVATVAIIASDRKQARTIFRYTIGLLKAVPMLAAMIENETADTITLNNNVVIEIGTASLRSTRGYSYAAVLCDEIAFWRSEDSANPDTEILSAIRPGMATIPSSVLIIASSPYRKRGVLWNAVSKHYGQEGARVLVAKATSLEMNPALDPAVVAEAYEADPDAAAAEYGGEFRADLSDFVPRDVIDACTVRGLFEIPPLSNMRYSAFIDPSGGTGSDSMTLAISHREGDKAILDCVVEARPPFSPDAVVEDFARVLKTYRVTKIRGDRWGGDWVREPFRKKGITYETSEETKSDIYHDVLPVLSSGRAQLLNIARLATQFCGLERRTSRSGKDSIDHAPGSHDDLSNAAAGALLMVCKKKFNPVNDIDWVATGNSACNPSIHPESYTGPSRGGMFGRGGW